jgi:MazG family protein
VGRTLEDGKGFERLVDLVATLRGDKGCPWDRAQTPDKIKVYLIEEAYEVLDALDSGKHEEVCGELGDLLFHIVFLARLYEETRAFNIVDVISAIVEKMTDRHPHVFGKAQIDHVEDVKEQWHEIKAAESARKAQEPGLFSGVPAGLPALMRAYRLGERASRVGMHWQPDIEGGLAEIEDLLDGLKACFKEDKDAAIAEMLGNVMFAMIQLSRSLGVHPETALGLAVSRFTRQLRCVEKALKQQGLTTDSATKEVLDVLWQECRNT